MLCFAEPKAINAKSRQIFTCHELNHLLSTYSEKEMQSENLILAVTEYAGVCTPGIV